MTTMGLLAAESPKIMIVDDNPANLTLLQKMLHFGGYENTVTENDSRKTIEKYMEYQPDLLLLDLQMPYMDGFDVLDQLNKIKESDFLPVIMITAQNDKENRLKALDLGAKDFIVKPFDHTEVMMRIRNMLEMRLLHKKEKMNSSMLEVKVRQRTQELYDLQIELISRLLRAAEFRDHNTGSHITRIGIYAYELAKAAGFSEEYASLLYHASMMHDIGKIGIPDDILLKPEKLNDAEWISMKQHTVKGAQILADSSSQVIQMAERIALTHHEWWNGNGYPNGLKGENIPIEGRITALLDVFDALTNSRPYKKAWSVEKAVTEVRHLSGSHFDPNLVSVFIAHLPVFMNIQKQFDDSNTEIMITKT